MKAYLLLRYYLNLNTKNLNINSKAIRTTLTKSLIKEDINSRLDELIKIHLNFQDNYLYRIDINKLSNRLWHAQIRAKRTNTDSLKLDLIYKLQNNSLHLTLIK